MRIPTVAFGKEFTHIPEHVREDLESLARECVVYTDHWIDELEDFRHVQIRFTDEERAEFARRSWAYELFLRAEGPEWAIDTPGIDPDVAKDADSYSMTLKSGEQLPPPYHCFAAFRGPHLESLVCGGMPERERVIESHGRDLLIFDARRAIETLTPTIRSFNNREAGLAPWTISCEDDVRDLLFVMLRPSIHDLCKEEPVPSRAGTHKVVDLCSKALRLMIEVKWIGRSSQWKKIVEQLHVDVQTYHTLLATTSSLSSWTPFATFPIHGGSNQNCLVRRKSTANEFGCAQLSAIHELTARCTRGRAARLRVSADVMLQWIRYSAPCGKP